MSNEFKVPARPWTEADITHLINHAHLLDAETRAELGLAEVAETVVVTEEILEENPVLAAAGVQVGDVGVATDAPEVVDEEAPVDNLDANNA